MRNREFLEYLKAKIKYTRIKIVQIYRYLIYRVRNLDIGPDIRYESRRGLRKESIEQLSTNHYIQHHRNVIVQGATGTGKSYLANALVNHAIESGFTGKYYRMTELLNDIDLAELHGNLDKLLKKLMKVDV